MQHDVSNCSGGFDFETDIYGLLIINSLRFGSGITNTDLGDFCFERDQSDDKV